MLVTPAYIAEALLARVGRAPPVTQDEAELQRYLHPQLQALFPASLVIREDQLGKGANGKPDRPDFAIPTDGGLLVVEVKVKGSASEVEAQIARYAWHDRVCGVALVTTRAVHVMPAVVGGKPCAVACLAAYL